MHSYLQNVQRKALEQRAPLWPNQLTALRLLSISVNLLFFTLFPTFSFSTLCVNLLFTFSIFIMGGRLDEYPKEELSLVLFSLIGLQSFFGRIFYLAFAINHLVIDYLTNYKKGQKQEALINEVLHLLPVHRRLDPEKEEDALQILGLQETNWRHLNVLNAKTECIREVCYQLCLALQGHHLPYDASSALIQEYSHYHASALDTLKKSLHLPPLSGFENTQN